MKVLHISHNDKGGGGIATSRINDCLNINNTNINSKLFVSRKYNDCPNTFFLNNKLNNIFQSLKIKLSKKINILQDSPNKILHSLALFPSRYSSYINNYPTDIIHLHWVQNEMLSIEEIGKIRKPIVWTLHDAWPFCGSEHYPYGLEDFRYQKGYLSTNKNIRHKYLDLDRWCWERKIKSWKQNFSIVCPSNWLANCAKKSLIMRSMDIVVIPNPINTNLFKPYPKKVARDLFNLPLEKNIILFGAIGGTKDNRKGADLLLKSINYICEEIPNTIAVIFGQSGGLDDLKSNIPIYSVGILNDSESMALLYSVANLFIIPSRLDNLPNTGVEATACGLPIVGFEVGGLPDIVENNKNGYLVEPFNYKKMGNAISKIINNENIQKEFGLNSRAKAYKNFSYERIAFQYKNLYKEILKK